MMTFAGRFHELTLSTRLSAVMALPVTLTAVSAFVAPTAPLAMAPAGFALAAVLARMMMRPLAQLVAAVETLPAGGGSLAECSGGGEIAVLARAFDRVATQRKREAGAHALFQSVIEACPNGMVVTDQAGIVVMINAATGRLFGYRQEELLGQTIDALMPAQLRGDRDGGRLGSAQDREAAGPGSIRQLTGLRKDGTEIEIEIGFDTIELPQRLVLATITDVTERRRRERLKDEFVSTVSHELRTPLTSISGSLALLAGSVGERLPETARRLLTIAHTNSERLVRLINDILEIEKIESDEVSFDIRRVEARALLEQAIEAGRVQAAARAITVRLDPDAAGVVRADPDRLVQVVTNLLSNAIKFSPAGGEVSVSMATHRNIVAIAVRDRGPGIPAEFRSRVFTKFAQAGPDSRQKGGTGLGLSIVKAIVTRLGGSVGFGDAPGGGTIFEVELPAWDDAVAAPTAAARSSEA